MSASPPAEPTSSGVVRRAGPEDAAEVVRLAELMYRSLGVTHPESQWERWRGHAEDVVRRSLGERLTAVVADDPDARGRLLACGAAIIVDRLPNPSHADSRVAYIQWMSTDTAARRRGLGTAVLGGLLEWCEERGVDNVELHASPDGVPLYRAAGFWAGSTGLAMRRRPWDPPSADAP